MSKAIAAQTRIPLVVDDREGRSVLLPVLGDSGDFRIEIKRLSVGDYLLDDRFLFERKTLPDLAASIASGRLFKQALRLAEVGTLQPVLILEGQAGDVREIGMRREAIQGALITVSLFVGLPVLRTRTPEETVKTFCYAARQGRTVAQGALPRRGHRPKGKTALQSHILQGLPGVGPERAARLIERFGSVRAVFEAREKELASISGVGPKTARRINWAVKEAPARYEMGSQEPEHGLEGSFHGGHFLGGQHGERALSEF